MESLYDFFHLYTVELMLFLTAVVILLLLWLIVLQRRISMLQHHRGKPTSNGASMELESWLEEQRASLTDLAELVLTLEAQVQTMQERVNHHVGRVGVVRFNPFNDTGGVQSFAVAWLDEEANGVVLSSLYSRSGMRIYAKPLERGESTYALSEEEEEAIRRAQELPASHQLQTRRDLQRQR
ncbi:MAG: DUF4446 family protein [Chloroflexota bacterium]|nr:DUF4446 family protein [Chloroflexota bacterium]